MTRNWTEFKQYMFDKYPICEHCGERSAVDVHHWIIHYDKRFWKVLDTEENCGCVCRQCHASGQVNNRASRVEHWLRREAQGFNMKQWYDSLAFRFKERFP